MSSTVKRSKGGNVDRKKDTYRSRLNGQTRQDEIMQIAR